MELLILNLFLLVFSYQFHSVTGKHHHDSDDRDDKNDLSDHCIHVRMDHETKATDYLICPYGCCGTLDDQKCCEDPDKEKHEEKGNVHLVRGLLIFAAVMLIIALSCCVFGIYKHKKAKLRKTSPGKIYQTTTPVQRTAPYAVFYTPRSGMKPDQDSMKTRPVHNTKPERTEPVHDISSAPPRYSETDTADTDLPLYSNTPPPAYSLRVTSETLRN